MTKKQCFYVLKKTYKQCRRSSIVDCSFCYQHKKMVRQIFKSKKQNERHFVSVITEIPFQLIQKTILPLACQRDAEFEILIPFMQNSIQKTLLVVSFEKESNSDEFIISLDDNFINDYYIECRSFRSGDVPN